MARRANRKCILRIRKQIRRHLFRKLTKAQRKLRIEARRKRIAERRKRIEERRIAHLKKKNS